MLLAAHVAGGLLDLADAGDIPDAERTGVVLAGDLYSAPDAAERGATGVTGKPTRQGRRAEAELRPLWPTPGSCGSTSVMPSWASLTSSDATSGTLFS